MTYLPQTNLTKNLKPNTTVIMATARQAHTAVIFCKGNEVYGWMVLYKGSAE